MSYVPEALGTAAAANCPANTPANTSTALRRWLDSIYLAAAVLGAVCIALICALMVLQSLGRQFGFTTGAVNDIVSWLCAAAAFFTMAHAFTMDLFEDGSFNLGRGRPLQKRSQATVRVLFGLFGAILASVGAWKMTTENMGLHLKVPAVVFFAGLVLVFLWNIALARKGRLPVLLFGVGFATLFLSRVILGR